MKKIARIFTLCTALFLAAPLRAEIPAIPDLPIPQNFGVNIHFLDEELPEQIAFLKKLGVGWVRLDLNWARVEKVKGIYDFTVDDAVINALHDAGIRILAILDYANPHYDGDVSPYSPEGRAAFANFAEAAALHYAGKNIVWEIYNEPNIQFWSPRPDVKKYIALADETTAKLRAAVPYAPVVGPALSGPTPKEETKLIGSTSYDFLKPVLASDAAKGWSAITIHPYRTPRAIPESATAPTEKIRQMMRDSGLDPEKIPVIAGEWGYSTWDQGIDNDLQAAYAVRTLLWATVQRMPFSIWYDWQDDGPLANEREHRFGLLRHGPLKGRSDEDAMKPSFRAVMQMSNLLRGYRFDRLVVDKNSVLMARYTKAGREAYALWTTDDKAHSTAYTLPAGSWSLNPILGGPASAVLKTGENHVFMASWMPVIILQADGKDRDKQ